MISNARRRFLKASLGSAAALTTASTLGLHLCLSSKVLAQNSARFNDYKALVVVYLYGGNDSYNLLVPTDDAEYSVYRSVRQNLAFAKESLLPIYPQSTGAYRMGMPSAAASLHELFSSKKMSIVANVGPLSQPLTKAMVRADESLLPPQLFSHNDQQSLWESGLMNPASNTGWGGRMADLIADTNDALSMNLSINGTNLMQAGMTTQPFSVDKEGPQTMTALDDAQNWNARRVAIFERILADVSHPLERAYAQKLQSASNNNKRLLHAISNTAQSSVNYPQANDLAQQLKMVATLIASQPQINQARQIYFVGMGGWDTHDEQSTRHPQLLAYLGDALRSFQQDIESRHLSQQVTTFTMSEFGRTLTSNGDGTDHGWGGHQLIMGGAVKGGELFGQMPSLALGSRDDLGDGRMLPSLSVDQFGADIAGWFGLSTSEQYAVFPNLQAFDETALKMFKPSV